MKKIIPNEVKSSIERLNYVFAKIESYINTPEFEREGADKYLVPVSLFSAIAEWSGVSEDEVFTEILIGLNQKYSPQRIIWLANPTNNNSGFANIIRRFFTALGKRTRSLCPAYCIRVIKVNDKSSDKVKKIYEDLRKDLFN